MERDKYRLLGYNGCEFKEPIQIPQICYMPQRDGTFKRVQLRETKRTTKAYQKHS